MIFDIAKLRIFLVVTKFFGKFFRGPVACGTICNTLYTTKLSLFSHTCITPNCNIGHFNSHTDDADYCRISHRRIDKQAL